MTPPPSVERPRIISAIENFPFYDYGMDSVSQQLREDRDAQEWVEALADAILEALGDVR